MKYSREDVIQYAEEEDVKFIRLAFCDVFGRQKNVSVMPEELPRAFEYGIAFDASSIVGFGDEYRSDLLLRPEPDTLMPLPWRPEHGRVVQMFSTITRPDGSPFACDTRSLLRQAAAEAKAMASSPSRMSSATMSNPISAMTPTAASIWRRSSPRPCSI